MGYLLGQHLLPAQQLDLSQDAPPAEAAAVADGAFHAYGLDQISRQGRKAALRAFTIGTFCFVVACRSRNHMPKLPLAVDVLRWTLGLRRLFRMKPPVSFEHTGPSPERTRVVQGTGGTVGVDPGGSRI